MATAEELLAGTTEEILVADLVNRTIVIPASLRILGVESDDDVRQLHFSVPRYYGDVDLSEFKIRINFENAKGEGDSWPVDDLVVNDDDTLTFSWLVDRSAFMYAGDVIFNLCMKKYDAEGIVVKELNTTTASLPVLKGLETSKEVVESNPSAFDAVLFRLYAIEETVAGLGGNVTSSGGNSIYYMDGEVEYPVGEGFHSYYVTKHVLSNSGSGIKEGDIIVTSNGTLCKVTSVSGTNVGYAPIGTISGSGMTDTSSGGNSGYPDWSHLKWYVVGDSLTAKDNDFTPKRYYDFVQEKTGIQLIVDGIGGTGYGAGVSNSQSFVDRVKNIPEDVDVVTIFGSGNDILYANGANTEIYTALSWIAFNRPGLRVIVAPPSPWKGYQKREETWKTYCDRLQVCALACDFRYLSDLWECPPFNPNFEGHMEKFFTTDSSGIHPNEAGHEALATYFYNALAQELEFDAGSGVNGTGGNVDLTGVVKSVNGQTPDENGNVEIAVSGGGGMSPTASALLITILRNGVYNTNQSANITALEAALASGGSDEPDVPVDPEKTLTSISATYSGGNVPVGTSVLALTGIVVTAHYSDGSTATVTGYTLSGTIAEGRNTVTVSYSGKTTTFTVTGAAESGGDAGGETYDILYELAEATTFDGTNSITTDVTLYDEDRDYSVVMDVEFDVANIGKTIFECWKPSTGVGIQISTKYTAATNKLLAFHNKNYPGIANLTTSGVQAARIVAIRTANDNTLTISAFVNGTRVETVSDVGSGTYERHTNTCVISRDFVGTINDLKIYNRALTSEEVEAYLA